MNEPSARSSMRRLPIWGFVVLAAFYLAAIQLTSQLLRTEDAQYGTFVTTEQVLRNLLPSVTAGALVAIIAVAILRWWRPVMKDDDRTPRWTLLFPIVMAGAALVTIDYSLLVHKGLAYTVLLLLAAALVGISEETMFRGIGVVTFRQAGLTEGWVALWVSVLFGLAHASNIVTAGLSQLPQVLATAIAGYFFYLNRRSTGVLWAGFAVHGLWDLSLFTRQAAQTTSLMLAIPLIADFVLAIVALATVRKVFPRGPDASGVSPRADTPR